MGEGHYHRNIDFVNNTLRSFNGHMVFARSVKGLNITGNTMEFSTDYPPIAEFPAIHFSPHELAGRTTRGPMATAFRTIAKVSGWACSLSAGGVAVDLYGGNTLATKLQDGSELKLRQETHYPWDGAVRITIESCKIEPFEMLLRIPDWAEGTRVLLNGEDAGVEAEPGSYARIERQWKGGDVVAMDMPMDIKLIEGHPRIEEVRNQVAIKRGPVVYCVESPDLPEGTAK